MIKDFLNHRNPNKRVIARANGLSLVELPDRVGADNIVKFRFAIARTDAEGNASGEDGIILSLGDLRTLAAMIGSADIRAAMPYKNYQAEHAKPSKAEFHLF